MNSLSTNIKNAGKIVLKDFVDCFIFFLAFSASSMQRKIMLVNFGTIVGYKNLNTSLSRFCKKGFIYSLKAKGGIFLKASSSMRNALLGDYAELKIKNSKGKWDEKWRLVIYDIPEKRRGEREYLRRTLHLLGFGKIQASAWASPYDYSHLICDLGKKRKIMDYLCIYEGKFFAGKEIDVLAKQAWSLKDIRDGYEKVIEKCELILNTPTEKTFKDAYQDYVAIYNLFKETVAIDPFLPAQFLIDWPYRKVEEKLRELSLKVFGKESKKAATVI